MNLQIEKFKNDFQNLINSFNDLPIGIIYYILKYEMKQIENLYYGMLNSELLKEQQQKKQEDSSLNLKDEAN